mgnify:CR=1 FL=1
MLKFSPRASRASLKLIHNFLLVSPFSLCRSLRVSDKPAENVYNYNSLPFTMKHFFANFRFQQSHKQGKFNLTKIWHRFRFKLIVPP